MQTIHCTMGLADLNEISGPNFSHWRTQLNIIIHCSWNPNKDKFKVFHIVCLSTYLDGWLEPRGCEGLEWVPTKRRYRVCLISLLKIMFNCLQTSVANQICASFFEWYPNYITTLSLQQRVSNYEKVQKVHLFLTGPIFKETHLYSASTIVPTTKKKKKKKPQRNLAFTTLSVHMHVWLLIQLT